MRQLSSKTTLCYHIEVKKFQKHRKVQKLRQLSESCQEGLPEGSSRAGEGEGPEAGRKRAGHFTDGGVHMLLPCPVQFSFASVKVFGCE